ncbi:hypothetical protein [Bradyrhizobium tropiciagri]|uniref:hypothetical protein n=1 Tax=Bradyrhizobium tropiciagri TaxID=312253 RepID=UPI00067CD53F|nr:hypothetical protein [Bradyrhizobium tropiciagri]
MSEQLRQKGRQLAEALTSASAEMKEGYDQRLRAAVESEHAEFKKAYANGSCYLCGDCLTSFDESKPCAHWLLNPAGFRKKKHFELVTSKYGFHQLQSFLRWLANADGGPKNINDLPEEGTGKLREVTIRYKDLEWAFSSTLNDFHGHGSGTHRSPHYHFQMRQGTSIVIRYNDFHVPFSERDILEISAEMAEPDLKRRWSHGEGMKEAFREDVIEAMLERGGFKSTGDGAGDVKFDHFITADEGTTIKGEDILALYEEAKSSGVPIATLLKQGKLSNVSVTTIASPGPGVVEQKTRSGRGGKAT